MKRTNKQLLTILLLTIVLAACKKNKPAPANGLFVSPLYNCSGDATSNPVYVCFDSLLTDSRCPINANCITSGYALIKISFHENDHVHVLKMSFPATISGGVNDTIINGYHLVLKNVAPYPGTGNLPIANEDRKATIEINQ